MSTFSLSPSKASTRHNRSPDDPHSRARRLSVNITPVERVGRIVIGLGAVIAGAVFLVSASSVIAVLLAVLLVAAGLDLVITGALGHCPLYAKLGHVPRSLRSSS
jgi:Protein of unknown function (DUF2892)